MPEKAKHQIRFKNLAAKAMEDLRSSQPKVCRQIQDKIDELKKNLFPNDYKKLKNSVHYRVDSGEYRIIYEVIKNQVIVYVLKIAHRKDVYR